MEKKYTLQDVAALLAEREALTVGEAENFVRSFFELTEEGLLTDSFVKVTGFGTLKLVEVSERESVNINTGERFQISGHNKISFTPDSVLRELVNRPFAGFSTVTLNENTPEAELDAANSEATPPNDGVSENHAETDNEVYPSEKMTSEQASPEGKDSAGTNDLEETSADHATENPQTHAAMPSLHATESKCTASTTESDRHAETATVRNMTQSNNEMNASTSQQEMGNPTNDPPHAPSPTMRPRLRPTPVPIIADELIIKQTPAPVLASDLLTELSEAPEIAPESEHEETDKNTTTSDDAATSFETRHAEAECQEPEADPREEHQTVVAATVASPVLDLSDNEWEDSANDTDDSATVSEEKEQTLVSMATPAEEQRPIAASVATPVIDLDLIEEEDLGTLADVTEISANSETSADEQQPRGSKNDEQPTDIEEATPPLPEASRGPRLQIVPPVCTEDGSASESNTVSVPFTRAAHIPSRDDQRFPVDVSVRTEKPYTPTPETTVDGEVQATSESKGMTSASSAETSKSDLAVSALGIHSDPVEKAEESPEEAQETQARIAPENENIALPAEVLHEIVPEDDTASDLDAPSSEIEEVADEDTPPAADEDAASSQAETHSGGETDSPNVATTTESTSINSKEAPNTDAPTVADEQLASHKEERRHHHRRSHRKRKKSHFWRNLLIILLLAGLGAFGYMYFAHRAKLAELTQLLDESTDEGQTLPSGQMPPALPSTSKRKPATTAGATESATTPSPSPEDAPLPPPEAGAEEARRLAAEKRAEAERQARVVALYNRAARYPQVKDGSMLIVGTHGIHKMKAGDNVYKLAERTYGNRAFAKYIICYNGISSPDFIKVNTTLKLPKLVNPKTVK